MMNIDLKIELLLDDINEYVNSTLLYLTNDNLTFDLDELIMYLSTVDDTIQTIKKLLERRK